MHAPWPSLAIRPTVGDLVAGVSVALVLIPQSVAYAVLAGMPPERGVAVGIVAALAAAPLVSSPFLQSGPTAVSSLLVLGTLSGLAAPGSGDFVALAGLLALMVGGIRLAIGLSKAGELAFLLSAPVLAGFTSAAAVVIAASQLPVLTGVAPSADNVAVATAQVIGQIGDWRAEPLLLGAATITVVRVCRRLHPLVPGVLVAMVGGLAYSAANGATAVLGDLPSGAPMWSVAFPGARADELLLPAVIIAVIGFSEAAAIARTFAIKDAEESDGALPAWDPDREFVSQGASNLAAGLFGGFPCGASFSRSALNRQAGATTAWSGLATGLIVLAAVPFVDLLADLPVAVLGGVIVAAVLGLADPKPVLALRGESRQQLIIAVTTAALTMALAPKVHWAILTGVVLSIGAHLRRERLILTERWEEGDTLHIRPTGVLWFGSAPRFEAQVAAMLDEREWEGLAVHLQRLGRTDVSGAYALRRLVQRAEDRGMAVTMHEVTIGSQRIVERVVGFHDRNGPDTGVSPPSG